MISVIVKLQGGRLEHKCTFWCGILNPNAHYYVNRAQVKTQPFKVCQQMIAQRNEHDATQAR
jgi:hypothetical protein